MIRTQSTPRKFSSSCKLKRVNSASPSRLHFSPQKQYKLHTRHDSLHETPTKIFAMDNLNASLNHYFSPKKKLIKSPSRASQRHINFDAEENFSEEENQKTSNFINQEHALECNFEDLINCFSTIDNFLPKNFKTTNRQYKNNFSYWKDMVIIGQFNLLFHGLGNKQILLNSFLYENFSDFCYIEINCFNPGVNCYRIFEAINNEFKLNVNNCPNNLTDSAIKLRKAIENSSIKKLFLALHNIEAYGLRNAFQQEALSVLGQSTKIHIIATIDHVNTTLMWKQEIRDNFNWLVISVPTYQTYKNILLDCKLKSLGLNIKQKINSHSFASLDVFWQAASQKMRKILQTLAIYSENLDLKNFEEESLSLSKLCKILKQNFATTNEAVLRQQLGEFIDLNIIKIDKKDNIQLIVNKMLLVSFLESKNEL